MNTVDKALVALADFWARNQDAVITATAAAIALLVVFGAWRFHRTQVRSRLVGNMATVMTLAWESQGVWVTATHVQKIPVLFVAFAFTVFELLQGSAMLKAEEDRKEKGHPGWAGRYTFAIGITAGIYASFGESTTAGVFQRIGLPILVLGYYWKQLVADRIDDSEAVIELRRKMKESGDKDDSVWVNPLSRIFIKLGLKGPPGKKVSDAKREYRIALMVTFGYRVYAGTFPRWFHRWRLATVAGGSEEADVQEARLRLDRKIRIAAILLPEGTRRDRRRAFGGQLDGQSVDGQSTGRLASQSPVAGAVALPVSRASQLTSRLPVGELTGQLATDGYRLPTATGTASQSGAGATGQSTDGQPTATEPFPTDDPGLRARLLQLIEDGSIARDPADGTVSVADARRAFTPPGGPTCGPDKARRILKAAGMYREPAGTRGEDGATRVNGNAPHLAG